MEHQYISRRCSKIVALAPSLFGETTDVPVPETIIYMNCRVSQNFYANADASMFSGISNKLASDIIAKCCFTKDIAVQTDAPNGDVRMLSGNEKHPESKCIDLIQTREEQLT